MGLHPGGNAHARSPWFTFTEDTGSFLPPCPACFQLSCLQGCPGLSGAGTLPSRLAGPTPRWDIVNPAQHMVPQVPLICLPHPSTIPTTASTTVLVGPKLRPWHSLPLGTHRAMACRTGPAAPGGLSNGSREVTDELCP